MCRVQTRSASSCGTLRGEIAAARINDAANYAATCVLPLAKHGGKGFHQPYGGYTDADGERRECVLYLNGRAHHWPKPIQDMEVRSNLALLGAY